MCCHRRYGRWRDHVTNVAVREWCGVSMSLAQQVRVRRLGCTGQALRHDDLIAHNVLFSSADAKWCGHLRTLVADVTDDVHCVCTFANEDLSLPLKTDVLTMRVQRLSSKLVTFKCPTCAKHYTSEVWYRKHLSRCPQAARAIMSKLDIDKSSVYKAFTLAAYVHQCHTSWTSLHTGWNPSAVGRFRSPHQLCGTLFHLRFSRHLRWLCFVNDWRRIYFRNHSLMSILWWLHLCGPRNNICYSGHVKYFSDWLIDWFLFTQLQLLLLACLRDQICVTCRCLSVCLLSVPWSYLEN